MILATLLLLGAPAADDLDTLRRQFEQERAQPAAQRSATISRIGALRTDDAARFLIAAVPAETEPTVRFYLLNALGATQTAIAYQFLVATADDGAADATLRGYAVNAIGQFRTPEARDYLVRCVRGDATDPRRINALWGLRPFPLEEVRDVYFDLLDETNPTIQGEAFRRLTPLKDPRVFEAAAAALANPAATEIVKEPAVDAIKEFNNAEAAQALLSITPAPEGQFAVTIAAALGGMTDDGARRIILAAALRAEAEPVRVLAVRALVTLSHDDVPRALRQALRDGAVAVRVAAIESMGLRGDAAYAEDCRRVVSRLEGPERIAGIESLGRIVAAHAEERAETVDLLVRTMRARDPEARIAAAMVLADLGAEEALERLGAMLEAADWRERSAAIRALVKMRRKESIDLLIPRLEEEEGRLLGDAVQALVKLTGRYLGRRAQPWEEWWAVAREGFEFPTEEAAGVDIGATGAYYGIPLTSERVIFVLDMSGSMSAAVEDSTRMEQAKHALADAIRTFNARARFNVIFFDDRIEPWETRLQPATPENVRRAEGRIATVQPRGGTNIYDPLAQALEDPDVDTVFLLSDGAPGSGRFVATDDILREIGRVNRTRQVTIHTISLGASPFMRQLAEQNGGRYVER